MVCWWRECKEKKNYCHCNDFGSSMERNKKAIETLVDKVLLLIGTQDQASL